MLEVRFDNLGSSFGAVMANSRPSGPLPWIQEGLLALRTSRESSGAHLRLFCLGVLFRSQEITLYRIQSSWSHCFKAHHPM